MKIWIALIPLFCSMAFAEIRVKDGKMTADIINLRLDKVLEILREQTDIQFYIDDDVTDQFICTDFQNLSIGLGIRKMLEGTGINYAVIANKGKTKAIFIGSSQKPKASYRKLDASGQIPWRRQTTYQGLKISQPPQPAKNDVPQPKKKQPINQVEPVVVIPTAGDLNNSPNLQRKRKEE